MKIQVTCHHLELSFLDITVGKVYDVIRDDGDGYIISDDEGDENIVFYDECVVIEENE